MTRFEEHHRMSRLRRISRPTAVLFVLLAAALGLAFSPPWLANTLRGGWREALRPGLLALGATTDWASERFAIASSGDDGRLREAQQQITVLQERLRKSELELAIAHSDYLASGENSKSSENANQPPALVVPQAISARVLGREAQAFLAGHDVIDVGRSRGAVAQAKVIDDGAALSATPILDQGRNAAVAADRLVLAGSRVWGKVAEVGQHTSTIQRVTDAGYRDLVQLATRRDGQLHFAARGVLVGKGEPLCKIELVQTTEPITVGDLVFTADDGVLDTPLLYGRVARVQRKPGQAHWEIWMEPAIAAASPPGHVAVLRMELNPTRLAGQ